MIDDNYNRLFSSSDSVNTFSFPEDLPSGHIGVDIEKCHNNAAHKLQKRLLTGMEQETLGKLMLSQNLCIGNQDYSIQSELVSIEEDVLLRFSFKEAFYKAINPYLQRFVKFSEAEIYPAADGTAIIRFCLDSAGEFRYKAEWRKVLLGDNSFWLTMVYLSAKAEN